MRFNNFIELTEETNVFGETKLAVIAFGRYNPPTRGHIKVFNKVHMMAEQNKGDPFIFISQTHDKKRNPLTYEQKVHFLQELAPEYNYVLDREVRTLFDTTAYVKKLGYTDVILIAGEDRLDEYHRRFSDPIRFWNSFLIESSGARDPDGEDAIGMSSTRARTAAVENDIAKFRATTGWRGEIANELMNAVREGLGVK